uniref:Casein kinase substrate phosphoprotein PP28 domain-containing protein n=1 Tax=Kalanchoe fedtschenkoi TaxID=63787 RepID=A0A7N0RFZ9_KALFE
MGRGKFKGKPTGRRQFSTPEEMVSGFSARPRTFRQEVVVNVEEEQQREDSGDESKVETEKRKGTEGIIEIENPNLLSAKALKTKNVYLEKKTELSRREREEIEKHKSRERFMRLQEQGKTEQARKDLDRLAVIRQQRAEAAKKREQEKAAKDAKKAEIPK